MVDMQPFNEQATSQEESTEDSEESEDENEETVDEETDDEETGDEETVDEGTVVSLDSPKDDTSTSTSDSDIINAINYESFMRLKKLSDLQSIKMKMQQLKIRKLNTENTKLRKLIRNALKELEVIKIKSDLERFRNENKE